MSPSIIPQTAFALSMVFLGWECWKVYLGLASRGWLPVTCLVQRVWISEHTSSNQDGADSVSYSANVEYSYKIGPDTYTSTRLSYQPSSSLSHGRAKKLLRGFHSGQESTAFYNPKNKSQAVLIRSAGFRNLIPLSVAGLLCALTWYWSFVQVY
ncbi:DUF3592 domain-containing protein [Chitinibacteraceae bacterium HSL-7]